MQFGSIEHKKEYFTVTLPKELNESIFFLGLKTFIARAEMDTIQKQKEEAVNKLENKGFPNANVGKQFIKTLEDGITEALLVIGENENKEKELRKHLQEVQDYAKEQGWEAV